MYVQHLHTHTHHHAKPEPTVTHVCASIPEHICTHACTEYHTHAHVCTHYHHICTHVHPIATHTPQAPTSAPHPGTPRAGARASAVTRLTSSASWPRNSGFSSVKRSSCSPAMVISCSSSPAQGEGDVSTHEDLPQSSLPHPSLQHPSEGENPMFRLVLGCRQI